MSFFEALAVGATAGAVGAVVGPVALVFAFFLRGIVREWWLGR